MKLKALSIIILTLVLTIGADAQTRRSTSTNRARSTVTTKKAAQPITVVDKLVTKFDEISQKIDGISSQYQMQNIMNECLSNPDFNITDKEAENAILSGSDKERLAKSISNLYGTMARNIGGAQAQSNSAMLIEMTKATVEKSQTVKELFLNLGMDIFTKTTGRTSF